MYLQPTRDTATSKSDQQTEMRCSQLENRAKLAEDRAARNETLLNSKMMELSKLQNTLTQQTKVSVSSFLTQAGFCCLAMKQLIWWG